MEVAVVQATKFNSTFILHSVHIFNTSSVGRLIIKRTTILERYECGVTKLFKETKKVKIFFWMN